MVAWAGLGFDNLGSSWTLVTSSAPWGPRAFFGAVSIRSGQALVVLGGVREHDQDEPSGGVAKTLAGEYSSDVWWMGF